MGIAWIRFKASFTARYLWPLGTAKYFLSLAWLALRRKIIIMDSNETTSRGGYKYLSLHISKRPVSAAHTYEDV